MPEQRTQYRLPMILQLFKNREAQLAAKIQDNPKEGEHRLEVFTTQPAESDFESVMEWIGLFFQFFWLALLSGGFLLVWVFVLKLAGF